MAYTPKSQRRQGSKDTVKAQNRRQESKRERGVGRGHGEGRDSTVSGAAEVKQDNCPVDLATWGRLIGDAVRG